MIRRFVIGLILILAVFPVMFLTSGASLGFFWDIVSAAIAVFVPLGAVWISHGPVFLCRSIKLAFGTGEAPVSDLKRAKACFTALTKYMATTAVLMVFMGAVYILANYKKPEELGPSFAVALLSVIYACLSLLFFSLPLAARLEDRITKAEEIDN